RVGCGDPLVGGRASADAIRTGAEEAEISGVFDVGGNVQVLRLLDQHDLLGAGEPGLILRRILSRAGPHRLHVNGRPAPLGLLQTLQGFLVDIHGQHDQQSLFKPAVQLALLDAFGELTELTAQYALAFEHMRNLNAQLAEHRRIDADRLACEKLLYYQVSEVFVAYVRYGEYRDLERS